MRLLFLAVLGLASVTVSTPVSVPRQSNKLIPVVVGGPQDTFNPNQITAAVGDIVQFQFSNGNHTVTQSAKDSPCTPLKGGVHSGHIPFQDNQTTVGTFNMVISTADPIFLYCATGPHCQEGQVMIVNPTSTQELLDYVKASQGTKESTDGTDVVGGTVAQIDLAKAGFAPAPPGSGGPPGGAPPAAPASTAQALASSSASGEATSAAAVATSMPSTTASTATEVVQSASSIVNATG